MEEGAYRRLLPFLRSVSFACISHADGLEVEIIDRREGMVERARALAGGGSVDRRGQNQEQK